MVKNLAPPPMPTSCRLPPSFPGVSTSIISKRTEKFSSLYSRPSDIKVRVTDNQTPKKEFVCVGWGTANLKASELAASLIVTSSAIDKKLEIYKNLEIT